LVIIDKSMIKYFVYFLKLQRCEEVLKQSIDGYIHAAYFIDPDWIISTQETLGDTVPSSIEHEAMYLD
jgi:hypothetical protein